MKLTGVNCFHVTHLFSWYWLFFLFFRLFFRKKETEEEVQNDSSWSIKWSNNRKCAPLWASVQGVWYLILRKCVLCLGLLDWQALDFFKYIYIYIHVGNVQDNLVLEIQQLILWQLFFFNFGFCLGNVVVSRNCHLLFPQKYFNSEMKGRKN